MGDGAKDHVGSVRAGGKANPCDGRVVWDPVHSLWNGAMLAGAMLAPLFFSWSAVAVGLLLTGTTILLGHSVGYHRLLIHRSFACPPWLERLLVWSGTLVGMGGPFWMIRTHDIRDWAQRQPDCHDYLAHRQPMATDAIWQMHCRLDLAHPPTFDLNEDGRSGFYHLLERTWMMHQLPLAMLLYLGGGWPWVIWAVCVRVTLSVTGHWFVGYLAHNRGPQSWHVRAAGVQAHDVPWAAIPTMGEAWHNNHHAYPGSARIGLLPGQADPGFAFIRLLERLNLAWAIQLPPDLNREACLRNVRATGEPAMRRTTSGQVDA